MFSLTANLKSVGLEASAHAEGLVELDVYYRWRCEGAERTFGNR